MKAIPYLVVACSGVAAAPSPLDNVALQTGSTSTYAINSQSPFPLYFKPSWASTSYPTTNTGNSSADGSRGLYQCIRDDLLASFPQALSANAAVADNTIRAFYGTQPAHNGAINTNFGCCSKIDSVANCGSFIASGGTTIMSSKAWYSRLTDWTQTQLGTPPGGAGNALALTYNLDFILAAQWQYSWGGTTVRASSEYCDQWRNMLTLGGSPVTISTSNGLNWKTKCTYLLQT